MRSHRRSRHLKKNNNLCHGATSSIQKFKRKVAFRTWEEVIVCIKRGNRNNGWLFETMLQWSCK